MATEGRLQLDVAQFLEKAFRRCGKLSSTISGELMESARLSLWVLLYDLANRGLSLWCIDRLPLGMVPYAQYLSMPSGTVDVLDAYYRTSTVLNGTVTVNPTNTVIQFDTPTIVRGVKLMPTTAFTDFDFAIDWSNDGITWRNAASAGNLSASPGYWACVDVPVSASATYWRYRRGDSVTTLPTMSQSVFFNAPYEVSMSKLSRDDYSGLPNKTASVPAGSRSLQYWYDKQISPRIWIWPVNQSDADQLLVVVQRQIQDVTTYTQSIDVPARWYEGILFLLAARCAIELPPEELPPGRLEYLEGKAEYHLLQAEDSENDGAPISLVANISGYTA